VEMLDAYSLGLSGAEIRQKIAATKPQVIGISSLTPQWPDAVKVADIAKSVNPDVLTVVGGPHVTALAEESAAHPTVDVAVIGEGEETIKDICAVVAGGGDLADVKGIVVGNQGEELRTKPRELITALDDIPFPAHDLLPEPAFYNPFPAWGDGGVFSCIISGRGCPYNCCFCDVTSQQGRRYRLRSAVNIADELSWLNGRFGVTMLSFRDPSMFCSRKRLFELCDLIKRRGLDISWTCNGRANEINPEVLAAMKGAGCKLIQFGIEVGNPEMLRKIKNITRERVAKAVTETRRAGISAHGYFLFGFVDETRETMDETIAFAKELDLDSAGFAVMVPFPGTQEFEKYRQEGLLLTEDWRDYNVNGRPVYRHKNISNEELARAPHRAYRQFYLRPNIIWSHMKKMTSPKIIRNYLQSARVMLR
jgi:anaerobic magnesium-protoporphyrin IX monomethyl ester cyclase